MGSVLNWFVGALLFLILAIGFAGVMGQDIGLNGGSSDIDRMTNSSGELSISDRVGFFTGLSISFDEAPGLVAVLLGLPTLILLITGYLLIRGVN